MQDSLEQIAVKPAEYQVPRRVCVVVVVVIDTGLSTAFVVCNLFMQHASWGSPPLTHSVQGKQAGQGQGERGSVRGAPMQIDFAFEVA